MSKAEKLLFELNVQATEAIYLFNKSKDLFDKLKDFEDRTGKPLSSGTQYELKCSSANILGLIKDRWIDIQRDIKKEEGL